MSRKVRGGLDMTTGDKALRPKSESERSRQAFEAFHQPPLMFFQPPDEGMGVRSALQAPFVYKI
ncbi:hypothetical protein DC415_19405 [Agrobacterium tumefaciens]|uniref:Uncharacterized protein n=1 Tax=Rhizobium rhizogenes TaxID=359 RepID=A0AA92C269_RHIRH|nr:hypothetical protein DC430_14060 [Rhizobium rhizogenes]PVE63506.1 hypothetical protein DC415_19405 [Agrobacterium tumefaciens]PVE72397.1 hypothetical protein DCP16_19405 [Sphingomonas sp. TPD3009]